MLTVDQYQRELPALLNALREITSLPQGPERMAKLEALANNEARLGVLAVILGEELNKAFT